MLQHHQRCLLHCHDKGDETWHCGWRYHQALSGHCWNRLHKEGYLRGEVVPLSNDLPRRVLAVDAGILIKTI